MNDTPDIVLVHGFPLDEGMWADQVKFLQAFGARVFTPNLPGFGSRPGNPAHRCSISAFAEDIHQYIIRNCTPPCIIGGFSMGGYVVLSLLNRFGKDACAAILMDTHPAADSPETRQGRLQSISRLQSVGVKTLVDEMLPRLLSPAPSPQIRDRVAGIIERQNPIGMIQAQMAAAMRIDQTDHLHKITIPCLVMGGTWDAITPPEMMKIWQSKIGRSRWVEIPNAGHLSPMEAPDQVNQAIGSFITEITSAGR